MNATTADLTAGDHLDHLLARMAWDREGHIVEPGLYKLGRPKPAAPVFVSANYTLSFDALRSSLKNIDCYILVLDTKGINVWCAAGKGTFGTQELIRRIKLTKLDAVVTHRNLILPQLSAPGVQAHVVKQWTGFNVKYGPVRAKDIPQYLKNGATEEMRRVTFPIKDRAKLVPVEVVLISVKALIIFFLLWLLIDWLTAVAFAGAVFAGTTLFPLLLPYIPTKEFSSKGFLLGILCAVPFAFWHLLDNPGDPLWLHITTTAAYLLALPALTAFLALNFTGATTFTSRTGVRKEMYTWVRVMAATFVLGAVAAIVMAVVNVAGVISRLT